MADFPVSTTAGINSALASAAPGDTITCAAGAYAAGTINSTKTGEGVTIRAGTGATCTFAGPFYILGQGLHFERLNWDAGGLYCSIMTDCSFKHCEVHTFFQMRRVSYTTVQYCNLLDAFLQMGHWSGEDPCHHINIICNLFGTTNFSSFNDHIQGQSIHDCIIAQNTFYDAYISFISGTSGEYHHIDQIQVFPNGANPTNNVYADNWFYDDLETQQQGVQLFAMNFNVGGNNQTVEGNIMMGGASNGLFTGGDCTGTVYDGNIVLPSPSTATVTSLGGAITLHSTTTVPPTINNNWCANVADQPGNGWPGAGNVFGIGRSAFTMATDGADITDYQIAPGGPLDGLSNKAMERINAIIAGTQDFYAPDGTLYLSGTPYEPPDGPTPPTNLGTLPSLVTFNISVEGVSPSSALILSSPSDNTLAIDALPELEDFTMVSEADNEIALTALPNITDMEDI